MTTPRLTRSSLTAGIWQGELAGAGDAPQITVSHAAEPLDGLEMTRQGDVWHLRFAIPAERIADGVQTFVMTDASSGAVLASFAILAGEALDHDIRAEVDLLRAELDILQRAFRRHCVETSGPE